MTWIIAIIGLILPLFFGNDPDEKWKYFSFGAGAVGGVWLLVHLVEKLKVTFLDLAAVGITAWLLLLRGNTAPPIIINPEPEKRKPILPWRDTGDARFLEGDVGPGGQEVMTDLPKEFRKKNIESKGLGCCVFRSADHAAYYQQIPELYRMPEWMKERGIEGGGYPSKVDKLIAQICKERGVPTIPYIQHEGGDPAFLDRAMQTGRMICVTYDGHDPRYGMNTSIAHMVNLVYLDDKYAAIFDNNFVENPLFMSRDDFIKRWKGNNGGWAFVLLASPPPQPPVSK